MIASSVDLAIEYQSFESVAAEIASKFKAANIPLIAIATPHPGAIYYGADTYQVGLVAGIRQPGLNIIDTTITKAIRFRERFTTELRGEFYNFFNHTNFGGVDLTFGSPTFGRITSAGAPFRPTQRIIQMAAKFYF